MAAPEQCPKIDTLSDHDSEPPGGSGIQVTPRVALVTGAGRGIGRATAEALAADGWRVVVAELRPALGRAVARALSAHGARFVQVDVGDARSVARMARRVGRVDCLVNNAGVLEPGPLARLSAAAVERMIAVNLAGPILVTRALLPGMLRRRAGIVVNVASLLGRVGMADYATYCATKFGVIGFTEALADEVPADRLGVVAVCPGQVNTPLAGKTGRAKAQGPHLLQPQSVAPGGAELFAERGYDGVPVTAIAQRAGVNKAMINYHFGGKWKLYRAIVSATFAEIVAGVEKLAESRRPAPEVLRELIAVVGEMATRRHPHFCSMMLREVVAGGTHLDPELIDKPARILGAVQRIVARGVADGDFRPVDPLLTHLSLVGSLVFFFATAPFPERVLALRRPAIKPPDAAAYVKHIQDLLTHGLAAGSTRGRRRR